MKKIKEKIFLCLALSALIIPVTNVFAEEEENPTQTGAPTPTESPSPTTDPGVTPAPSDSPVPTEAPVTPELQTLSIDGVSLSPTFSKNQENYTAVVAADVESVNLRATAANGMTINGTGTRYLKEGSNVLEVTVVAGTSGSKTYKITVTRSTNDLSLKSLRIQGQNLNEAFEPTVLNYTADIPYNMDSVIIQAGANNTGATFQVLGNTNLKVGKNTVRIIVKNAAGETQEYRIIVTRAEEGSSLDNEDDDNDNLIETSIETSTSSSIAKGDNPNKDNTLKYILVVIFCLILLIVAGIGIYFYIRTGDSEKRKQKKLEKIKKRQEKLNQELTGLTPVVEDTQEKQEDEEIVEEGSIGVVNELEDTIQLNDETFDEETKEINVSNLSKPRSDKNVLEDFDDLFLDE